MPTTSPQPIMVIEDSSVVRNMLSLIISNEGYGVIGCENAIEALEYLRRTAPPRLIFLDMVLSYMTADQFLSEKNRDPRLSEIPVVMISSYPREEARISLRGTVAFLQKPIDLNQLMATVQRFCD